MGAHAGFRTALVAAALAAAGPPLVFTQGERQVIRSRADLVTSDVSVRDAEGRFVPDLRPAEFEIFEDGVRQQIVSFAISHGGRIRGLESAPAAAPEGIVLPGQRPVDGAAGRVFVVFVDDQHLDPRNTPRIRDLVRRLSKELIREGDLFAVLSTGPSSIEVGLTYDRKRLDDAVGKIIGNGLSPSDILEAPASQEGVAEVRHRVHVAFSTAYDLMESLTALKGRRKAFIYISNGYDLNPYPGSRAKLDAARLADLGLESSADPFAGGVRFAEADLAAQLAELTRAANRANVSIYTIDPRGLVAGPDLDQPVDRMDWQNHVTATQSSLRVLAELTGGIAAVNQNDISRALARIDADTSDYYILGYYSSNPDPSKRRRRIDVRVTRPGVRATTRTEYVLPPVSR